MKIIIEDKFKLKFDKLKDDSAKKLIIEFVSKSERTTTISNLSKQIIHYTNGILGVRINSYYRLLFAVDGMNMIVLDLLDKRKDY